MIKFLFTLLLFGIKDIHCFDFGNHDDDNFDYSDDQIDNIGEASYDYSNTFDWYEWYEGFEGFEEDGDDDETDDYFDFINLLDLINVEKNFEEDILADLFDNYDKKSRPVKNNTTPVILNYGLEVKSLEFFDQKAENIQLNFWLTLRWYDEYLKWNFREYPVHFIDVKSNDIWLSDFELYNSAMKPYIYERNSVLKLYWDGEITWVRPVIYTFSCKLDLHDFPFDTQTCNMTFGSWKFSKSFLDMKPFENDDRFDAIFVDQNFSHNEWNIVSVDYEHADYEYNCCPGELWPNTKFIITLQRNPNKYLVVIIMSTVLTTAALVIMFFKASNYRRTYLLVFIPLTIIWLQIYIASKIPVISYATLMEKFFVACYVIMILGVIESGLVYNYVVENITNNPLDNDTQRLKTNMPNHADLVKMNNAHIHVSKRNPVIVFDNIFRIGLTASYFISIIILLS